RQRRIGDVLKQVRDALLPGFNERRASRAIDDAARGRRASFRDAPALRVTVERQLRQGLGSLDDVPGAARIRQLLRESGKTWLVEAGGINQSACDPIPSQKNRMRS